MFNVTLSGPTSGVVTVNFSTQNGTANAGSDFTGTAGVLTFNPGQILQAITVQVTGDVILENNEVFLVNLTNPSSNAQLATAQGRRASS